MNLTTIHNIGEFYSHHYLDALLEKDLRGVFARWQDLGTNAPDARLARLAKPYFEAKCDALRWEDLARRYPPFPPLPCGPDRGPGLPLRPPAPLPAPG